MEAMDYETVRCGPLMTKEFVDHIKLRQQSYASRGPAGEEPLVELQALEEWVMVARERQSERDDNARRAKAIEANGGEAPLVVPINANLTHLIHHPNHHLSSTRVKSLIF